MALHKIAIGVILFICTTVWAIQADHTYCPQCYTHTVVADPPFKPCPTLRPVPFCGIACPRLARRKEPGIDAAASATAVTVAQATTTTVATVTATVPGPNPACPATATVTVTSAAGGGPAGAATPDVICPQVHRPACTCGQQAPEATVVVVHTISKTATVLVTEAPLTCSPLPTSTPAEASIPTATENLNFGFVAVKVRAAVTVTMPSTLRTITTGATSSSSVCSAYTTRRESRYCLDDRRGALTTPPPDGAAAAAHIDRGAPEVTVTRGCQVYIILEPPCPTLGI